jgi:hypothetical protein
MVKSHKYFFRKKWLLPSAPPEEIALLEKAAWSSLKANRYSV